MFYYFVLVHPCHEDVLKSVGENIEHGKRVVSGDMC